MEGPFMPRQQSSSRWFSPASWLRRFYPASGRQQPIRRRRRPRSLRLEVLEDRTVPSTVDLGLLRLSGDFPSGSNSFNGSVAAGFYNPTTGGDFTPLANLNGSIAWDTTALTLSV